MHKKCSGFFEIEQGLATKTMPEAEQHPVPNDVLSGLKNHPRVAFF
jgi:hypothetical protein